MVKILHDYGAELREGRFSKLGQAINKAIEIGNIDMLHFLLDKTSGYRESTLESLSSSLWTSINHDQGAIT